MNQEESKKMLVGLNKFCEGTLMQTLGMEFTEVGEDFLKATMPIDERTFQPMGLLHGGASVALAESIGSAGAYMFLDRNTEDAVCLEINANHLKSASSGHVTGVGTIIHKGSSTQVWTIDVFHESGLKLSTCRMTMMIKKKR